MDKKEMKRENGKGRTRSNNSQSIKCTEKLFRLFKLSDEEIKRLHDMSNVKKEPARKLWKRVYNKIHHLLVEEGVDSPIPIIAGNEKFMRETEKIIKEWRGSIKEAGAPQCEIEFPPEKSAASWLKVEIAPWVERVKFPGGYETKLAKVNLLVSGKLEVDGAAEVVIPFNGPYQVRWHLGHSSAFKPTPEAKREAEIAIVEAFVRHVDAMRARFANLGWWGIEK